MTAQVRADKQTRLDTYRAGLLSRITHTASGKKAGGPKPRSQVARTSDSHLGLPEMVPRGSSKSRADYSRSVCLFPQ